MRLILFSFLFILCFNSAYTQEYNYITPSLYTTFAGYTDGAVSKDVTLYLSHNITDYWHGTANFGLLNLKHGSWSYPQLTAGYHPAYYYFPFTLKFDLEYVKGSFEYQPDKSLNYSDHTRIGGVDFLWYSNSMYFGAAYTYLSANGILNADSLRTITSHQASLRFVYIYSYDLSFTLRPTYTNLSDGRKLFSLYGRLNYQFFPGLVVKAGGFAGNRAYYYDTDLFTLFNQNDTQKYQAFIQSDYNIFSTYTLSLSYQHTKFNGYSINYYIAGIKTYFTF